MTRKECLDKAAECVLRDRQNQYGKPEDCFGMIARMWGAYLGVCVSAHDVAAMMALLKIARFRYNPSHEDNAVDCAGYAACMVETATAWEREGDVKAEGGCCQKGKDHSPEEPEFKPGDAVEWNSIASDGLPAVYLREFGDFGHCVVRLPDGRERIVSKADLRRPEANHPENPDSSPGFKRGDKVQAFNGEEWVDCRYIRWKEPEGRHVVQYKGCMCSIDPENLRPVSRAEGCEEPAYNLDDDMVGGVVTLEWPRGKILEKRYASGRNEKCAEGCEALVEKDAPRTREELFNRIVDCNPVTFKARTPMGEELAEMAEEEEKHG